MMPIKWIITSTEQIEQLRIAERNFAICRHDLRHHLSYLNACILENKSEEAAYISQTFHDMDNMKVERYSQNEPVNLILSSYVSKEKERKIPIEVSVSPVDFIRFQITDLCSLLTNALENAVKACTQKAATHTAFIKVHMYEKNKKLCIQISNSFAAEPIFQCGILTSHQDGHGIGVKSMIHVIKK